MASPRYRVKRRAAGYDNIKPAAKHLMYLSEQCPYTADELKDSLLARCDEDGAPTEIVNEFISNVYIGAKEPDGTREIKIDWNI